MLVKETVYILCIFVLVSLLKQCLSLDVTVSTCNLWNFMFNWDIRKHRIAELIRESNSDIVAFQEVRSDFYEEHSQVLELKKLLPEYRWAVWRTANTVAQSDNFIQNLWAKEGIGVLSKRPILTMNMQSLPNHGGPDTNKRIALHVSISLDRNTVLNLVAVHFSYHRQQQCHNSAAILEYIRLKQMKNVIIVGDFNTYMDYDAPVRVFTDRVVTPSNPCYQEMKTPSDKAQTARVLMMDTWIHSSSKGEGLTFSNMPTPGYESRPDRILVTRQSFKVKLTRLSGNGTTYKSKYQGSIKLKRVRSLIRNAFYTFQGYTGFSCDHDCGPRGVCRCGMCVKGDNSERCDLPNCNECNGYLFGIFISYSFVLALSILSFLYALLRVLVVSSKFSPETFFSIMGCTCCLFNPQLYSFQRLSSRHRSLRIFAPIVRLPPMVLLICALILIIFLLFIGDNFFQTGLETASLIMDEEFFPSDHLMYTARLEMKS
ncbi:uncharacterized protein LOC124135354 [Haliotis rufescens]|uniref:uncharacterized protein LOC124135354 n=1 Tax=Haliotis rufescens TaxID=6454 RepID=UPI00201EB56C|nr:uncharacterized protein LOC124135354 [Haliotis rufescens]